MKARIGRSRSARLQDVYRKGLKRLARKENARMREIMSPYFTNANAKRESDKFKRYSLIINAVQQLGLCSVEDISKMTGLNNRSIQSTMPFLVRTKKLERRGTGAEIRMYKTYEQTDSSKDF